MQEKLNYYEEKMNKSLDSLQSDYAAIRAGRANPHVLDKIRVDYYRFTDENVGMQTCGLY